MKNINYIIHRDEDYLQHHGIKGQKWGIRRYENEDGTLTEAGKKRYAKAQYDASKYKTAGERLKTVAKSGLRGAVGGALFGLGAVGQQGVDILNEKGDHSWTLIKALQTGLDKNYCRTAYNLEGVLGISGVGAIGSMAASSVIQGAQAIKVKRGQNFVEKYKDAFEKTYVGGKA